MLMTVGLYQQTILVLCARRITGEIIDHVLDESYRCKSTLTVCTVIGQVNVVASKC